MSFLCLSWILLIRLEPCSPQASASSHCLAMFGSTMIGKICRINALCHSLHTLVLLLVSSVSYRDSYTLIYTLRVSCLLFSPEVSPFPKYHVDSAFCSWISIESWRSLPPITLFLILHNRIHYP